MKSLMQMQLFCLINFLVNLFIPFYGYTMDSQESEEVCIYITSGSFCYQLEFPFDQIDLVDAFLQKKTDYDDENEVFVLKEAYIARYQLHSGVHISNDNTIYEVAFRNLRRALRRYIKKRIITHRLPH